MSTTVLAWGDPWDPQRASAAGGLLGAFNDAGVLLAADVHVAVALGDLGGEGTPEVLLAAALAVRAPRLGHVCVDLATIAATAQSEADEDADVGGLGWPDPAGWLDAVAASPLVAGGPAGDATGDGGSLRRPLHLGGSLLYLDRYWREEQEVAADLDDRSARAVGGDPGGLREPLRRLFPDDAAQRLAGAQAALRRLVVVAGGPGTGKTTTVARILALRAEMARAGGVATPRVALAAPTGKAAARLEQSVREQAADIDTDEATRRWLQGLRASTIHRLLGWRRDRPGRFHHDRLNRLGADLVVIDETSMVSLSLMSRLLEAVRPGASIVLVGDPDQLSSVEAGAVLADVVGPAAAGARMHPDALEAARVATGDPVGITPPAAGGANPADPADPADGSDGADGAVAGPSRIGDGIVVLRTVHRFGGAIGAVAQAVQRGDPDGTVAALAAGADQVAWEQDPEAVRAAVVAAGAAVAEAAAGGDGSGALAAAGRLRVLCASRGGPDGVGAWTERVERWLAEAMPGYGSPGPWYPGRPLLVTRNDYGLGLFNGDIGVVVDVGGRPSAVFERQGALAAYAPARLEAVETVHAMTVHKGQGSQFDEVVVVLPDPGSRALTRELLYTAVTRARRRVVLLATEASVRVAVDRPVARASGLRRRLWGAD